MQEIFKFQAISKGINIILDFQNWKYQEIIKIDVNRLKKILFNLIGNSLKFINKGYIKISVSNEKIENVNYIKISVEDTGIGIKNENIPKLFKLFGKLKMILASILMALGLDFIIAYLF